MIKKHYSKNKKLEVKFKEKIDCRNHWKEKFDKKVADNFFENE